MSLYVQVSLGSYDDDRTVYVTSVPVKNEANIAGAIADAIREAGAGVMQNIAKDSQDQASYVRADPQAQNVTCEPQIQGRP